MPRSPRRRFGSCSESDYLSLTRVCIASFVQTLQKNPKTSCRFVSVVCILSIFLSIDNNDITRLQNTTGNATPFTLTMFLLQKARFIMQPWQRWYGWTCKTWVAQYTFSGVFPFRRVYMDKINKCAKNVALHCHKNESKYDRRNVERSFNSRSFRAYQEQVYCNGMNLQVPLPPSLKRHQCSKNFLAEKGRCEDNYVKTYRENKADKTLCRYVIFVA